MNKKQLLALSLIFWTPVVAFCYIAGEILERQPILFDTDILHWIHAHSTHFFDNFFVIITTMGNIEIITPLFLLIILLLWRWKLKQAAFIVASSFIGAAGANFVLKFIFHRQRPAFWHSAIHETGYSFPSGHAMVSSALVVSLIVIAWNTRWRWYVTIAGVIFMSLIGYSRLYLGVHYPTDIIAGWLASTAWVLVVSAAIMHHDMLLSRIRKLLKNR